MRIFLLPGFYGTGELFAPLCSALAKKPVNQLDIEVVRYQDEIVFDDYVESVEALLPDRDAVLVAESFSGPVALKLIARQPSRFRCAVLSATFPVSPYRALTKLAQYLPAAMFKPNRLTEIALHRRCLDVRPNPELLVASNRVLHSMPAHQIRSRLAMLASVDVRALLSLVTVPVLYLQAARDKTVSARLSRQITDHLPQVEVMHIDGPHFLLQSRPSECADAIETFLSRLAPVSFSAR